MGVLEIILRVSLLTMLIKLVMATNYIVGGPNGGWDTNSNLQTWASSQQFLVGDNLIFKYPPNHDVVEVTKSDYDSCQQTKPIQSYNDGATTITLTSQGKKYFICGTIGHCIQGMKVEINTIATESPSPSVADSPMISIIPSAAPEESFEASSPFFETHVETPMFSPLVPSTDFLAPSSTLPQHSEDISASSTEKGYLQTSISIVLSFVVVFMAFF